jgi:hypothetical protein
VPSSFMDFDFDAAVQAPFRMQPGLRRMADESAHLRPLAPGSRHQREKLAVLGAFWPDALLQRDGYDAGPALDALCVHAAESHPDHWHWDGARAHARGLGAAVDADGTVVQVERGRFGHGDEVARALRGLPPVWRRAGLLALTFVEDLVLLDGDGRVAWLAVTLPSHWSPADKLGLDFAAIHAPVPDRELLVRAGPALLSLARGRERWERFVWNVTGHPRLHADPRRVDPCRWPAPSADAVPAAAWFRGERQTLRPLPPTDALLFTIQVEVQPLARVIDHDATRAQRLHDAIASMSPAVLDYRALTPVRAPLLRWLAAR